MRNTTKFDSQKLDTYNSTYDFLKFAYKSEINELAFNPIAANSWGPRVNWACASVTQEQGSGADWPEFADGELSDEGIGTTSFPTTSRTH